MEFDQINTEGAALEKKNPYCCLEIEEGTGMQSEHANLAGYWWPID